jgi:hypothetical protein
MLYTCAMAFPKMVMPLPSKLNDASNRYYDVNGIRVVNPAKGSIVIDQNGNKQVK